MKHASKYISLIFVVLLTGLLLNNCATPTPKPVGELNKEEVIERYFKDRSLDELEGIWVREDNSFEIAILKNSFKIFPGYDYIGIVTDTHSRFWAIGETKLLIKKTSNKRIYSISYFDDKASVTKSQNVTDLIMMGDNIAKMSFGRTNYVLIKNYPQPEAVCKIGFEFGETNLILSVVSPYARAAGLLLGDKLKAINGEQVLTGEDVISKIDKKRTGDRIKIAVKRNQQTIEVETICKDGRRLQQDIEILTRAEARGKWDDCISKSYDAEQEWGKSSWFSGIRLDCAEEKRLEDNRMPDINAAELVYEHWRRTIVEAVYSQEELESIRSYVLRARSWLEANKFHAFADDLSKQWEAATKVQKFAPTERESVSFGTGFVVSPDGFLLTAYHVVEGAKSIKVMFQDGRSFEASVQQSSKSTDLAVLRVSALTPNYLPLVPTKTSKVGDPIFTMGFPIEQLLGKEPKFTDGTISALSGIGGEATFFQMSVPVQPGNSGGPVVNNRGEAIGIVTSTAAILPFLSTTGTLPQNINWAVKSDYAIPLFNSPPQFPSSTNREAAIDRVRNALCAIEATISESK